MNDKKVVKPVEKPKYDYSGKPPYPEGTVVLSGSDGTEVRYPDGKVVKR